MHVATISANLQCFPASFAFSFVPRTASKTHRILVLGGDGMLGHQVLRQLRGRHEVRVTLRRAPSAYRRAGVFSRANAYFGVNVGAFEHLEKVVRAYRPNAVVNAVGIVKQRGDADDPILNIEINSLFPHRLAELCRRLGIRLVHVSTDCVFSGSRGNYAESDEPNAQDVYGRSKLLGEIDYVPGITLRTSMIGPELYRKKGLLEWFLAQKGTARGYTKAVFSGFTTIELARVIERAVIARPEIHGVYHASAAAISKYDLLALIKRKLDLKVRLVADNRLRIDRSLNSRRFRREFAYAPPSWDAMITELANQIREHSQ